MIDAILSLVTGGLGSIWGYLAAGAGILATALGLYAKGRADANRNRRLDAAEDHIEARKEIDDALLSSRAGGGTWAERLRRFRNGEAGR